MIKKYWPLIICIVIAGFVYRPWFSKDIIARGDWKSKSNSHLLDFSSTPSAWDFGNFGGVSFLYTGRLNRFPMLKLQAFLIENFDLNFALIERLLWFYPFIILSILGMYLLTLRVFYNRKLVALYSTLMYVLNPYVIFRAHTAQMATLLCYALAPFILLTFSKILEKFRVDLSILLGVLLSIIVYNEIRILPIILLMLAFLYIYHLCFMSRGSFELDKIFKLSIVTIITFLTLNMYWLAPMILGSSKLLPEKSNFASKLVLENLSRSRFVDLAVLSLGADSSYRGYIYMEDQLVIPLAIYLFIVLYLLPLLTFKNNKLERQTLFFVVAGLLFVFISKGVRPPFSFVNLYLYSKMTLFSLMYRLPTKFMVGACLFLSFVYGAASYTFVVFLKRTTHRLFILTLAMLLPVLIIFPALVGKTSFKNSLIVSSFSPFLADSYFVYEDYLENSEENLRSIFLPGPPNHIFFNAKHPRYFPYTSYQKRSSFGKYFDYKFRIPEGVESLAEDRSMVPLLALMNIGTAFLDPVGEPRWYWYGANNYTFYLDNLESLDGLIRVQRNIYSVPDPKPRFYFTDKFLYLGGDFELAVEYLIENSFPLDSFTFLDQEAVTVPNSTQFLYISKLEQVERKPESFELIIEFPVISTKGLLIKDGLCDSIKLVSVNEKAVYPEMGNSAVKCSFLVPEEVQLVGDNTIRLLVNEAVVEEGDFAGSLIVKGDAFGDKENGVETNILGYSINESRQVIVKLDEGELHDTILNYSEGYSPEWTIQGDIGAKLTALGTMYFDLGQSYEAQYNEIILTNSLQDKVDWGWRVTTIAAGAITSLFMYKVVFSAVAWVLRRV